MRMRTDDTMHPPHALAGLNLNTGNLPGTANPLANNRNAESGPGYSLAVPVVYSYW